MSKSNNKYILVTWSIDEEYDEFNPSFGFVTSQQLDDINQLMREHRIKKWVSDPESITRETYRRGYGSLVEYRNVTVKPIKIVESWGYSREAVNKDPLEGQEGHDAKS